MNDEESKKKKYQKNWFRRFKEDNTSLEDKASFFCLVSLSTFVDYLMPNPSL